MPGRKPKSKDRVDVEYIVSWALYHSKIPVKKIAEDRGQTTASIYWQIKQIDNAIDTQIDKQKIRDACLLCNPLAVESLIHNLREKDVSMTQFFLKNILGFADKIQGEGFESANVTNVYNLGAGTNPSLRRLDPRRVKAVAERLQQRIDEAEKSPVVLRDEVSPDHEG